MKRFCVVLAGILFNLCLYAQAYVPAKIINPIHVFITCNKTSNFIFPYNIISVDRGSGSILAQKAKGVENILQLKADTAHFSETNVSIVTADAKFYSFLVHYADDPSALNYEFVRDSSRPSAQLTAHPIGKATYDDLKIGVIHKPGFIHKSTRKQKMKLRLRNIYLQDSLLLFGIRIENQSLLDYPMNSLRFFIKDRKRSKRTSIQEIELTPIYTPQLTTVAGKQSVDFVLAFKPFTFLDTQCLSIQITEKEGGRVLTLPVKSSTLLKVQTY